VKTCHQAPRAGGAYLTADAESATVDAGDDLEADSLAQRAACSVPQVDDARELVAAVPSSLVILASITTRERTRRRDEVGSLIEARNFFGTFGLPNETPRR